MFYILRYSFLVVLQNHITFGQESLNEYYLILKTVLVLFCFLPQDTTRFLNCQVCQKLDMLESQLSDV